MAHRLPIPIGMGKNKSFTPENRIKGRIAEAIIEELLKASGNDVYRFGYPDYSVGRSVRASFLSPQRHTVSSSSNSGSLGIRPRAAFARHSQRTAHLR